MVAVPAVCACSKAGMSSAVVASGIAILSLVELFKAATDATGPSRDSQIVAAAQSKSYVVRAAAAGASNGVIASAKLPANSAAFFMAFLGMDFSFNATR